MIEPSTTSYLEIVTIVTLGVFSFITLFERYRKGNYKDTIQNFRETIEGMTVRMTEMEKELEETRRNHQESLQKIAKLTGDNETLKSILLGRDPESETYRRRTLEAIESLLREFKIHQNFVKRAHPEID